MFIHQACMTVKRYLMAILGTTLSASRTRGFLILLCVSVPSFMINLDSNIIAVSLSSISSTLHADFAGVEWVVSAYTLTFAALLMPAGALADRYGRKRMLLIGLIIFTVASLLCGLSTRIVMLNLCRSLQGLGAALQLSAALATLSHTFRGAERARAFAFWGSVIGIAITLGPVAGGFITQHLGWQWAFYINIPVGLAILIITLLVVEESHNPHAGLLDKPGFVTFSASLSLLTLALISGNHLGWGSVVIMAELIAAALLLAAFIYLELHLEHPMLDLRLLRSRTFIGVSIAGLAFACALLTMLTYLPLYFQTALGVDPQTAGLLMLPVAVPLFIVPRLVVTLLTPRYSGRALLTLGLVVVCVGLCWLALTATRLHYLAMLGGLILMGCGAGILNGETAKSAMSVVPPERAGMASGISGTIRFSGIVIGFAALGAVLFSGIKNVIAISLPLLGVDPLRDMARQIAAGNLASFHTDEVLHGVAIISFAAGYQRLFFYAAAMTGVCAWLTWRLVSPRDTAPEPS